MVVPLIGTDVLLYVNQGTNDSPDWLILMGQRGCTLNLKMTTVAIQWKGSGRWTTRVPGDRDWSMDFTGLHYRAADLGWETSVAFLKNAFIGTETQNRIQLRMLFPGNHTCIGYGYMETMTLDEPVSAEGTIKGTFVADGELAFV